MTGTRSPATVNEVELMINRHGAGGDRRYMEAIDLCRRLLDERDTLLKRIPLSGRDTDAAEQPCAGCGKPLLIENAGMEDGCPCNTPAGVNNLNLYRWRLLHELQQRQARELAAKQAKIDRLMLEHCHDEMTPEQTAEWARHQKPVNESS